MVKTKVSAASRAAKLAGKVVDLEKKAFDRTAKVVGKYQQRTDKLIQDLADHAKWLPKEGKEVVAEWIKTAKRSRADIRRTVDVSFDQMGEFCKRMEASASRPAKEAKKPAPPHKRKPVKRAVAITS
ncbi:MAG: hypothetical protein K1Y02_18790 [Candidatus Hydrogenedentes bacterium]|nr:hypothetical protein [Candidatus Hydrogenedentota bacterium]